MNEQTPPLQVTPTPPVPIDPAKKRYLIAAILILVAIGFGSWIWRNQASKLFPTPTSTTDQQLTSSSSVSISDIEPTFEVQNVVESDFSIIGERLVAFARSNNKVYLKEEFYKIDPISKQSDVYCPREKTIPCAGLFSEDENMEPKEISDTPYNLKWKLLIKDPVTGPMTSLYGNDHFFPDKLFSFKQIPGSEDFLFVLETPRYSNGVSVQFGTRNLYWYGSERQELKEVMVFSRANGFSYPKIGQFSKDSKNVSLDAYSCWGCESNRPKTWLIDLNPIYRTGNYIVKRDLGQVLNFEWTGVSSYRYKDYIVTNDNDCNTEQACFEDPSALPFKTGNFIE